MKIIFLLTTIVFLSSCAKERPIENIYLSGQTETRIAKSTFNANQLWYSKATVISRSETTPSKRLFVGASSDLKIGYFVFKRDKLDFYDAVSLYEGKEKQASDDLIYSWNIKHSEYHLKEHNGEVTNIEEENDQIEWNQKNFFKINFSDSIISPKKDIGATDSMCWTTKSASMVENSQTISINHVAYTVEYVYEYNNWFQYGCRPLAKLYQTAPTYTVQIRYSFKPRNKSSYTPYVYSGEHDPLMKTYGYFKTRVKTLNPQTGMEETKWLMNRWNPTQTHTYYFAKNTPDELKIYYTHPQNGIFKKINDALTQTGESIRFEIKEYDPSVCQFGDVGCSFIKINTEAHNGAPLGFGPSYADPLTGEIISGNTMIWVAGAKSRISHNLKIYSDTSLTAPEHSSVYSLMKETLGKNDLSDWTATSSPLKNLQGKTAEIYKLLLPQYTYTRKNYLHTTFAQIENGDDEYIKAINGIQYDLENLNSHHIFTPSFDEAMTRDFETEVKVNDLLADHKTEEFFHQQKYNRHVDSVDSILGMTKKMILLGRSAEEIFAGLFYHTAIHELGHTLNLEHNFYGSVDIYNFESEKVAQDIEGKPLFYKDQAGNTTDKPLMYKPSSTTVMEYMIDTDTLDENLDWGPYDKAALLYAYSSGKKQDPTNFLFCTHDSVDDMALCNMHDTGITPSEIALSHIQSYENYFPIRNYRAGRDGWSTIEYGKYRYFFMKKLKAFMKMQKSTFQLGDMIQKLALSDYSEKEIETAYQEIQADMKQAVKITLAFYDAIIHQKNKDRSFKDAWNGSSLEKKGIWHDKLFAMNMLYQNNYMSYDPNIGSILTSYLDYFDDEDDELASIYTNVIKKGLIERVDEYADVDIYRLSQFIMSTVQSGAVLGTGEIPNRDLMGIKCFTNSSFSTFYPHNLKYEDAKIVTIPIDLLPSYYARALEEGESEITIAFFKEGEKIYLASHKHNPFAFELLKKTIDILPLYSEPLMALRSELRKVKSISKMYYLASEEDIYTCE